MRGSSFAQQSKRTQVLSPVVPANSLKHKVMLMNKLQKRKQQVTLEQEVPKLQEAKFDPRELYRQKQKFSLETITSPQGGGFKRYTNITSPVHQATRESVLSGSKHRRNLADTSLLQSSQMSGDENYKARTGGFILKQTRNAYMTLNSSAHRQTRADSIVNYIQSNRVSKTAAARSVAPPGTAPGSKAGTILPPMKRSGPPPTALKEKVPNSPLKQAGQLRASNFTNVKKQVSVVAAGKDMQHLFDDSFEKQFYQSHTARPRLQTEFVKAPENNQVQNPIKNEIPQPKSGDMTKAPNLMQLAFIRQQNQTDPKTPTKLIENRQRFSPQMANRTPTLPGGPQNHETTAFTQGFSFDIPNRDMEAALKPKSQIDIPTSYKMHVPPSPQPPVAHKDSLDEAVQKQFAQESSAQTRVFLDKLSAKASVKLPRHHATFINAERKTSIVSQPSYHNRHNSINDDLNAVVNIPIVMGHVNSSKDGQADENSLDSIKNLKNLDNVVFRSKAMHHRRLSLEGPVILSPVSQHDIDNARNRTACQNSLTSALAVDSDNNSGERRTTGEGGSKVVINETGQMDENFSPKINLGAPPKSLLQKISAKLTNQNVPHRQSPSIPSVSSSSIAGPMSPPMAITPQIPIETGGGKVLPTSPSDAKQLLAPAHMPYGGPTADHIKISSPVSITSASGAKNIQGFAEQILKRRADNGRTPPKLTVETSSNGTNERLNLGSRGSREVSPNKIKVTTLNSPPKTPTIASSAKRAAMKKEQSSMENSPETKLDTLKPIVNSPKIPKGGNKDPTQSNVTLTLSQVNLNRDGDSRVNSRFQQSHVDNPMIIKSSQQHPVVLKKMKNHTLSIQGSVDKKSDQNSGLNSKPILGVKEPMRASNNYRFNRPTQSSMSKSRQGSPENSPRKQVVTNSEIGGGSPEQQQHQSIGTVGNVVLKFRRRTTSNVDGELDLPKSPSQASNPQSSVPNSPRSTTSPLKGETSPNQNTMPTSESGANLANEETKTNGTFEQISPRQTLHYTAKSNNKVNSRNYDKKLVSSVNSSIGNKQVLKQKNIKQLLHLNFSKIKNESSIPASPRGEVQTAGADSKRQNIPGQLIKQSPRMSLAAPEGQPDFSLVGKQKKTQPFVPNTDNHAKQQKLQQRYQFQKRKIPRPFLETRDFLNAATNLNINNGTAFGYDAIQGANFSPLNSQQFSTPNKQPASSAQPISPENMIRVVPVQQGNEMHQIVFMGGPEQQKQFYEQINYIGITNQNNRKTLSNQNEQLFASNLLDTLKLDPAQQHLLANSLLAAQTPILQQNHQQPKGGRHLTTKLLPTSSKLCQRESLMSNQVNYIPPQDIKQVLIDIKKHKTPKVSHNNVVAASSSFKSNTGFDELYPNCPNPDSVARLRDSSSSIERLNSVDSNSLQITGVSYHQSPREHHGLIHGPQIMVQEQSTARGHQPGLESSIYSKSKLSKITASQVSSVSKTPGNQYEIFDSNEVSVDIVRTPENRQESTEIKAAMIMSPRRILVSRAGQSITEKLMDNVPKVVTSRLTESVSSSIPDNEYVDLKNLSKAKLRNEIQVTSSQELLIEQSRNENDPLYAKKQLSKNSQRTRGGRVSKQATTMPENYVAADQNNMNPSEVDTGEKPKDKIIRPWDENDELQMSAQLKRSSGTKDHVYKSEKSYGIMSKKSATNVMSTSGNRYHNTRQQTSRRGARSPSLKLDLEGQQQKKDVREEDIVFDELQSPGFKVKSKHTTSEDRLLEITVRQEQATSRLEGGLQEQDSVSQVVAVNELGQLNY